MAYDQQMGSADLRKEVVDETLKIFAPQVYKFKQALTIATNTGWSNTYWREDKSVLSGPSGNAIKGLPRGATFPQAVQKYEEVESIISKYGLTTTIFWEDIVAGKIDLVARSLYKLVEAIVKNVDDEIYATLIANVGSTVTCTYTWDDSASAAIIDNLEEAEEDIAGQNYDTSNLMVFISPKDKRSFMNYLVTNGAKLPMITNEKVKNGVIGTLGNKTFVVSNSVSASEALVVVPKVCGTWRELTPLSSTITNDAYVSTNVKACEVGVTEVTDPYAVVKIINTQA
jgi:hypothetical protein